MLFQVHLKDQILQIADMEISMELAMLGPDHGLNSSA